MFFTTEYDLVLRTCKADMTAYNSFKWPETGTVSAPDWDPKPECGNGLHGLLHGCGDSSYLSNEPDAKWLVVAVPKGTCVDIERKVKFQSCEVVYAGTKEEAIRRIAEAYPEAPVVYAQRMTGKYGVSTSGDCGTSTSGIGGKSTSGHYGTSISGNCGTSTSGEGGTSISCIRGKSTSGNRGKSTSGDGGTSTSGDYGTSMSGYDGTSTSGNCGTSTSGNGGKSTSGYGGTSTSGYYGALIITWYGGNRHRHTVGYIGETLDASGSKLEPNVAYKLDDKGNFVKA